jgi:hypothetical protein
MTMKRIVVSPLFRCEAGASGLTEDTVALS